MKRRVINLFVISLFVGTSIKGQYVTIPDISFRNALIAKYPTCFNAANQLDTTCSIIVNEDTLALSSSGALSIDGIQYFKNLKNFYCNTEVFTVIQTLPSTLENLSMYSCEIQKIRSLPAAIQTIGITFSKLDSLPSLPAGLKTLVIYSNKLTSLPILNASLKKLDCSSNLNLLSLPSLPSGLTYLSCSGCGLTSLPTLSSSMDTLICIVNSISSLPPIPPSIKYLDCSYNYLITTLPPLSSFANLTDLACDYNYISTIPPLPSNLEQLSCGNNALNALPSLPPKLKSLGCNNNQLKYLPNLPDSLQYLYAKNNDLRALPLLPKKLGSLWVENNPNLNCLPFLPQALYEAKIVGTGITCTPNIPPNCQFNPAAPPICNASNNVNQCASFPQMYGLVYNDNNNNGIKDNGDAVRRNVKVLMSNGAYAYTNASGIYNITADTIGSYAVSIIAPPFYNAVPVSYVHNFNAYSDVVNDTFALKASTIKDSLAIHITRVNRARPGFPFAYLINYENAGTTLLNPHISIKYDTVNLGYDSASTSGVSSNADSLFMNPAFLLPGETKSFIAYFTVSSTAILGSVLQATAMANAGNVAAFDFSLSTIAGSYDPNNKEATPELTPTQVASGSYIDYTIHFQNTGNDTAFNVVLADTLSNMLQTNVLQILAASHMCRTTLTNGIVYFEFLGINLPDSNVNKIGSNGFVRFRIRPSSTVVTGDSIPNKAGIYFDYNSPVITNTCQTLIRNTIMPVTLVHYKARLLGKMQVLNDWTVANEMNASHYNVQRSSSGQSFETIGFVRAGNLRYSYTDDVSNQLSVVNAQYPQITNRSLLYYRLEIVDNDGRKAYSAIQKVLLQSPGFSVYPNPATSTVTVQGDDIKLISIIDNTGRMLLQKEADDSHNVTLIVSRLQRGMYMLKVQTTSGEIKSEKLVIE